MDALSLRSSLSISKPFQCLPLSSKQQKPSHLHLNVSCRATKVNCLEYDTNKCNFYKMLSLSPKSATTDEIKRAYRLMALQYHPDVCHDPSMKEESTKIFVQLNDAYKTLSNPMLRAQYDSELGLGSKISVSYETCYDDGESLRSRWQEQVVELKTRSRRKMEQKGGSWSSRMRTQNKKNRN